VHIPAPALSGQAHLVCLQFCEGFPYPPLQRSGRPTSLLHVFVVLIAYYSVSLFSPGGGRSVQGTMLIWPRVVCGNTTYRLAHLVLSSQAVWARASGGPGALLVSTLGNLLGDLQTLCHFILKKIPAK
jgi:hypothetical protein